MGHLQISSSNYQDFKDEIILQWFDGLEASKYEIEISPDFSSTLDMSTNVNLSVYFSLSHIRGFGT